jgi:hypothetical protein
MNMLATLTTDTNIEDERDYLGGSRVRESGLHPFTVALAYLEKSKGGALALNLTLKDGSGEVRQQIWMTSGDAKGNKNYYEKDGAKNYLPGFIQANALALLTTGKEISQLDTEDKVVNVYNFDAKGEVPTKVSMVMDLLGKEVLVGLVKQTVDKNGKNPNFNPSAPKGPANQEYTATGETRDENEIDKLFRASDRKTTAEIRAQADTAVFADTWATKWTGQTKNKTSKSGGTAGAPKAVGGLASGGKPTTSLFG